ncbi:MAG: Sec-independent protein translocase protein TatB [Pseudomonadota bacterium]
MFDIGFSELAAIGVVALIVIGPERLPKVARTAGHLLGRLQRYVSTVKADISREMELDELKKAGEQFKQSLEQTENKISAEIADAERTMKGIVPEAGTANAAATNPRVAETPFIDSPQAELELEPVSSAQPDHSMTDTNKSKV